FCSRGEYLLTEHFPELVEAAEWLRDGTVIDGEILPWRDDRPLPFAQLQRRIGRRNLTPKIRSEVPISLVAYDLLELNGQDVRERPMSWRRAELSRLIQSTNAESRFLLSPIAAGSTWEEIRAAKE